MNRFLQTKSLIFYILGILLVLITYAFNSIFGMAIGVIYIFIGISFAYYDDVQDKRKGQGNRKNK